MDIKMSPMQWSVSVSPAVRYLGGRSPEKTEAIQKARAHLKAQGFKTEYRYPLEQEAKAQQAKMKAALGSIGAPIATITCTESCLMSF